MILPPLRKIVKGDLECTISILVPFSDRRGPFSMPSIFFANRRYAQKRLEVERLRVLSISPILERRRYIKSSNNLTRCYYKLIIHQHALPRPSVHKQVRTSSKQPPLTTTLTPPPLIVLPFPLPLILHRPLPRPGPHPKSPKPPLHLTTINLLHILLHRRDHLNPPLPLPTTPSSPRPKILHLDVIVAAAVPVPGRAHGGFARRTRINRRALRRFASSCESAPEGVEGEFFAVAFDTV